jgi:hypothetical protein
MWTTKETKREYRGVEIVKYEGSKMKDSFRKKDPRTFQSGDSKFTKWHSYTVNVNDLTYEFDKLKDAKDFIDLYIKSNEKTL